MIGWRTPDFWWETRSSLPARVLRRLGDMYGAQTLGRIRRSGIKFDIPVITIGAFALGGPGKTPTVEATVRRLILSGERPAILSRGYGSIAAKQRAPTFVNPAKHGAADVGDEPLLLARLAPVVVGADRVEAAWHARRAVNPSVLVLDDGLQSRQIEADLAIAVVDGEAGIGNGLCVPAGPLRAPPGAQMRYVDAIVIVGPGERGRDIARIAAVAGKTVLTARLAPKTGEAERFAGEPFVAFAGIGRPQKFFATLEQIGADIRARHSFADHHIYRRGELKRLLAEAHRRGARLVTTEKDLVRIAPPHPKERRKARLEGWQRQASLPVRRDAAARLLRMRDEVDALAVDLVFDDAVTIDRMLLSVMQSKARA